MRGRPEHDSTDRVEGKTHKDRHLVTLALQDFGSHRRVEQVAATKVHDLEARRLKLGNPQHRLEVLVQDVEQAVREPP